MRRPDEAELDLEAVRVLLALYEDQSVTAVAARLTMSQPSVSRTVQRMRHLFRDRLFVRVGEKMEPTPTALALRGRLAAARETLEEVLAPPSFDPASWHARVRLISADYHTYLIMPALQARLRDRAPLLDLDVEPMGTQAYHQLRSGEAMVGIGRFHEATEALRRQKLYSDDFVTVTRKGHPAEAQDWTLDTFTAHPHCLIAVTGRGPSLVDTALARMKRARRIALTVPHFTVAPLIVAQTDLILTLPRLVAERFAAILPLEIRSCPVALPKIDTWQVWHERYQDDPAHTWLRGEIAAANAASGVTRRAAAEARPAGSFSA